MPPRDRACPATRRDFRASRSTAGAATGRRRSTNRGELISLADMRPCRRRTKPTPWPRASPPSLHAHLEDQNVPPQILAKPLLLGRYERVRDEQASQKGACG